MTAIKVTHGACGDMTLPAKAVTLNISTRRPSTSHYTFVCIGCGLPVSKEADAHVVALLTSGGAVPKTRWEPPLEVLEPHPAAASRLLTLDDVIDFGLELRNADDCLSRWAA